VAIRRIRRRLPADGFPGEIEEAGRLKGAVRWRVAGGRKLRGQAVRIRCAVGGLAVV